MGVNEVNYAKICSSIRRSIDVPTRFPRITVAALLMLGLHLVVFKQRSPFTVNQERIAAARQQLSPMTCIALGVAVGLVLPYMALMKSSDMVCR